MHQTRIKNNCGKLKYILRTNKQKIYYCRNRQTQQSKTDANLNFLERERQTDRQTETERERERERELRTQKFITHGLRFYAVAYSYNLSLLIYMPVGYT